MKSISYSLFGYGNKEEESGFNFNSYLRGLFLNLRLNRLIYPDWVTIIHLDSPTYLNYQELFDSICSNNVKIKVNPSAPLCEAMLWRLQPIWDKNEIGSALYSHVICRDLDSPTTYREAQAVKYWINRDKAAHTITDSVSHNLPMLGGMIGFVPKYFTERTGWKTWQDMKASFTDLSIKGSDQTFLNSYVYPKFAQHGNDSITQHYVLGMANTFLSDCHNFIQPMELDVPFILNESNSVCGHIGAAGWYETAMFKFLRKYWGDFSDLLEIESKYKDIFYWVNE